MTTAAPPTTSSKPMPEVPRTPSQPAAVEAAVEPPPTRSRRRPFLILGAVVATVALALGARWALALGKETTDDAQIEADLIRLTARISGEVRQVSVSDNQRVKKGAVLLTIDDREPEAELRRARAELEIARSQLARAEADAEIVQATAQGGLDAAKAVVHGSVVGVSSADARIQAAQASLSRARTQADLAQQDLARTERLRAAGSISEQDLDEARGRSQESVAVVDEAEARLREAEQAKRAARTRVAEATGALSQSAPVESRVAEAAAAVKLAQAQVQAAEAAVRLSEIDLSYTVITAPEDGTVSGMTALPGQFLNAGQGVAELVPLERYVVANFKETQIHDMHPGDRADIEVDAYPGRTLSGKVESLAAGTAARFSLLPADNASGNFVKVVQRVPVKLSLQKPPRDLLLNAGLSAEVTVHISRTAP